MANRRSALKSIRVQEKKHEHNIVVRRELKKAIKKFQTLVLQKNTAEAKTMLNKVASLLDKAAKKNIIHSNTASRKKSRLSRKLLKTA